MMHQPDNENPLFTIAANFINHSNHSVFLTGKAGTGKTTFLKYIKSHSAKNTVIVAPTGVAAINAGGTTIHSFFNLPFSPFLPSDKRPAGSADINNKHNLAGKLRINNEKKELIQSMELLVIDEISMVRCDVLDAIDTVLRLIRNQFTKPFGGVQVLYIGDMYQLPPVVKEEEWKILGGYYSNPFFFSSKVIAAQPPVYIELQKVYRQKDLPFIQLLNQVRNNEMDQQGYEMLHGRYLPDFEPDEKDNYITLTTHNNKADTINTKALDKLAGTLFTFKATTEGIFNESAYPADEQLFLKIGAKVMFLKNDTEKTRRYYNGKIGRVHNIEDDRIRIECAEDTGTTIIELRKETWRNIRYTLNKKSGQIEEEELGSFTQYPLRLAWAITIHKSQGLTFEKAIIDAGSAFAPGQVYVALSRCISLGGMVLKSRISYQSLQSDERIVQFALTQQKAQERDTILSHAQREYQQEIIQQLFDFIPADTQLNELIAWNRQNNVFAAVVTEWLQSLKNNLAVFLNHQQKFQTVLRGLFSDQLLPEQTPLLQQRLQKAAAWFIGELEKTTVFLLQCPAVTDNRQHAVEFNTRLKNLFNTFSIQKHLLGSCVEPFTVAAYHQLKKNYSKVPFTVNAYAGSAAYLSKDILHPELYLLLKEKRNRLAEEKEVPVYMVCGTETIEQMAQYLPATLNDLGKINGFGAVKLKQYGNIFLEIIREYCEANNLHSEVIDLPVKKRKLSKKTALKPDTRKETYELYTQGKSPAEIAAVRQLAQSTIEGHLAHYIETGDIELNKMVDIHKQEKIKAVLMQQNVTGLAAIKQQLPNDISYGELKWVLAAEKKNKATAI